MRLIHGLMPLVPLAGMLMARCDCNPVRPIIAPSPLVGDFTGTYTLKRGEGPSADSIVQAITWTFTETNYIMDADTSDSLYDPSVCFCKGRGTYAVTDRVQLEPTAPDTPIPDNCDTCDASQSPQGEYALERPGGGITLTKIEVVDGVTTTSKIVIESSSE